MQAMNVIDFVRPGLGSPADRPRRHRVDTFHLASSISIVAILVATPLHLFTGVGEAPLVIGTILGASIAGWINAFLPARASDPDGGQRVGDGPLAGELFDVDAFDRAA